MGLLTEMLIQELVSTNKAVLNEASIDIYKYKSDKYGQDISWDEDDTMLYVTYLYDPLSATVCVGPPRAGKANKIVRVITKYISEPVYLVPGFTNIEELVNPLFTGKPKSVNINGVYKHVWKIDVYYTSDKSCILKYTNENNKHVWVIPESIYPQIANKLKMTKPYTCWFQ